MTPFAWFDFMTLFMPTGTATLTTVVLCRLYHCEIIERDGLSSMVDSCR